MKLNNIVSFSEERELVYMTPKEFFDNEAVPLQNIIILLNLSNQTAKFDCARLCYKKYQSNGKKTSNRLKHIVSPIKGTLRDSLSIELTKRYIKHRIDQGSSHATIKTILFQLSNLYVDLDHLNIEPDWSDEKSQFELYKKHANNLYFAFQQELKDENCKTIFYVKQSQLADLISFNLKIKKNKIKKLAWQAPIQKGNHRQPVGENDLIKFSKTNLLIFKEIKAFLMENKLFPLIIKDKKLGVYCLESHTNRNSEYYDMFIGEKGKFLDFDQAKANYLKFKKNIYEERIKVIYDKNKAIYEERNKAFNLFKIRLINKAVNAFVGCIFCDSAINPSLVSKLKLDSFDNPIATNKTQRTYLIKPRSSKSEPIPVSFTLTFKSIHKEFLEFREWVLNNLPADSEFDSSLLLFSISEQERKSDDQITRFVSPYKFVHFSGAYKVWFKAKFPNINYLPASKTRASISNYFYEKSNSSVVTAEKLGNLPKTTENAYSEATSEQFYSQMDEYFNAVYKTSYQRTRVTDEPVPVTITVKKIENTQATPTGQCSNIQKPQLDTGFKNISQPNCSNPTSCLFCDKYALHVDYIDIQKLLSLKEMTFLSINRNKEDEVLYIRYRIDEILEQIIDKYPESIEMIKSVKKSIEDGNYAEYWQNQIDLITELMDY